MDHSKGLRAFNLRLRLKFNKFHVTNVQLQKMDVLVGGETIHLFSSPLSHMTRGQAKKSADLFPRSEMGANETLRHH